jgi:hypothetical protein
MCRSCVSYLDGKCGKYGGKEVFPNQQCDDWRRNPNLRWDPV